MAFLTQLTRDQFAQQLAEEYSSAALLPANTGVGSDLGAIFAAESLNSVIIQQQIQYVNSVSRLSLIGPNPLNASLPNPDVDSFVNQFGVYRIAATPATGRVLFSLASPLSSGTLLIPAITADQLASGVPAVTVQTASGVQYAVVVDATNAAYNSTFSAYSLSGGQQSVSVTVLCYTAGINGNAQANQITTLVSGPGTTSVAGFASVTNPLAFTNAVDVEADDALKLRFARLMTTVRGVTANALGGIILGVTTKLTYSIGDQIDAIGNPAPGKFTVIVNNAGTGVAPPGSLLTAVNGALLPQKPLGITMLGPFSPTLHLVAVVGTIKIKAGYNAAAVIAQCSASYTALINNVGLDPAGAPTSAKLAAVYATLYTTPGVDDVTGLTLNGSAADVVAAFANQVVAGSINLTAA